MFDTLFGLVFDAGAAFNQLGFLAGGLICLALGLVLVGNEMRWRMKAARVEGTIVGVREKNGTYHPVYRYTLPSGQEVEATSQSGSGIVKGKETGRVVPLLVFPEEPDQANAANSYIGTIVGLVLMAPGVVFAYVALTRYDITPMTGIVLLAALCYLGVKAQKYWIPKDERPSVSEWKQQRREKRRAEMGAIPLRRIEDILASPEMRKQRAQIRKSGMISAPVILFFSLALFWAAHVQAEKTGALVKDGLHARGQVVELESEYSSGSDGGYSYYPIVSFQTADGLSLRFRDSFGSNPPLYERGESVKVLYLAKAPEKSARIDRGIWNWIFPGILMLFGGLLMLVFFSLLKYYRPEAV